MKRPYQIAGLVLLLLAVFIGYEALKLKYYTSLGPGGGFFPFWLSICLGISAVVMIYQATFKQSDPMPEDFFADAKGYLRIGAIILGCMAFVFLLDWLGFRLVMIGVYVFLLSALGRQNPIVTTLIALVGSFGVFQLFTEVLQVPLPIGVFGI